MRKLPALCVLLAVFAWSATSYGRPSGHVLVYKGTIKASKSIFDVNDTNNLLSSSVKGYWAVDVADTGTDKGQVIDSNAVIYDTREKYYKVISDTISIDPFDPCGVVMLSFEMTDVDGEAWFDVVGKGKLTKFSNDAGVAKDFVPTSLKGTGLFLRYDIFDPAFTLSGPITVTMMLDSARTRAANPYINTVDDVINDIVTQLTSKGGWTPWPYYPAPG
jgi:hypothetical protein